jgi:hypothetical protein
LLLLFLQLKGGIGKITMFSKQPPRPPAAIFQYNRPVPQEEQKRIVINLYESGIAEEFIALQLDLEIPVVIGILKESNIYRGNFE